MSYVPEGYNCARCGTQVTGYSGCPTCRQIEAQERMAKAAEQTLANSNHNSEHHTVSFPPYYGPQMGLTNSGKIACIAFSIGLGIWAFQVPLTVAVIIGLFSVAFAAMACV